MYLFDEKEIKLMGNSNKKIFILEMISLKILYSIVNGEEKYINNEFKISDLTNMKLINQKNYFNDFLDYYEEMYIWDLKIKGFKAKNVYGVTVRLPNEELVEICYLKDNILAFRLDVLGKRIPIIEKIGKSEYGFICIEERKRDILKEILSDLKYESFSLLSNQIIIEKNTIEKSNEFNLKTEEKRRLTSLNILCAENNINAYKYLYDNINNNLERILSKLCLDKMDGNETDIILNDNYKYRLKNEIIDLIEYECIHLFNESVSKNIDDIKSIIDILLLFEKHTKIKKISDLIFEFNQGSYKLKNYLNNIILENNMKSIIIEDIDTELALNGCIHINPTIIEIKGIRFQINCLSIIASNGNRYMLTDLKRKCALSWFELLNNSTNISYKASDTDIGHLNNILLKLNTISE